MKNYVVKGKPLKVYLFDSEEELSSYAADLVAFAVRRKIPYGRPAIKKSRPQ